MRDSPFPVSFTDVQRWAGRNAVPPDLALRRFLQGVVLHTVVSEQRLREALLLRGGAALWLFYGGARPSEDLDFMVLRTAAESPGPQWMADLLDRLLGLALPRFFPDCPRRMEWIVDNLKVDVCDFDRLTDCTMAPLSFDSTHPLRVCTLEDIVADKLVSLIEGAVGNRKRERDLFDVASMLRRTPRSLEWKRVSQLARAKARIRQCSFSADNLTSQTLLWLAAGYEALREQVGNTFLPLQTAWDDVVALVRRLEAVHS